jgi:putative salt-induced outer membrane protein YdiY
MSRVVLVAAILLAAARAEAQIVNVQSLIGTEIKEGFSGGLDAAADWRTGNVDLLLVGGGATARYRSGEHLVFLIVRGDYGRTGGSTFIKRTFEHARYRYTVTPRLTAEAFVQNEADEFKRLSVRALAGAGPRVKVLDEKKVVLAVGAAYMFEYELLSEGMFADSGEDEIHHRLSTYAVASYALDDRVSVSETIYFQPRLDAWGDFRLLDEAALITKLSSHVAFKTAFVLAHDADPPEGVEDTDTALQAGISITF